MGFKEEDGLLEEKNTYPFLRVINSMCNPGSWDGYNAPGASYKLPCGWTIKTHNDFSRNNFV